MGILEGETIVLFYGGLKTACVIFAIGNLELKKFLLKKASFVRAYISSYLQDKKIALCHKKMCEILYDSKNVMSKIKALKAFFYLKSIAPVRSISRAGHGYQICLDSKILSSDI